MANSAVPIVQYILIRSDLYKSLKWPLGAVIAQACHASIAVIHQHYNDQVVKEYLDDLDNMRKVILEVTDEEQLTKLSEVLNTNNIEHKVWIEQPENISTCIAVKPYLKTEIQKYFRSYKLCNTQIFNSSDKC